MNNKKKKKRRKLWSARLVIETIRYTRTFRGWTLSGWSCEDTIGKNFRHDIFPDFVVVFVVLADAVSDAIVRNRLSSLFLNVIAPGRFNRRTLERAWLKDGKEKSVGGKRGKFVFVLSRISRGANSHPAFSASISASSFTETWMISTREIRNHLYCQSW